MKIQGRDCTLTVAKDGDFIPLPYSEETVRTASKGYSLPCVIGGRNREKRIETKKEITGCFVTRLEALNVSALFLLLFYNDQTFDIYTDRVFKKKVYKNVLVRSFELRATNGDAFKFRFDLRGSEDSYEDSWPGNMPSLSWERDRTYHYNGHNVTADLKVLPLIYKFELTGDYTNDSKYQITLYFLMSTEFYPSNKKIDRLTIPLDTEDGVSLDLYDLEPLDDLCDINCADTVLCFQKFNVTSIMVLNIRNEREKLEVVL